MPEHGDYEPESMKWFCEYWMPIDDWYDIHDYSPPTSITQLTEPPNYKNNRKRFDK